MRQIGRSLVGGRGLVWLLGLVIVLGSMPLFGTSGVGAIVAPSVTGVSPNEGPIAGGTVVTVSGAGFTGATSVLFGGTSVVPTAINGGGTQLTATSPAHSAGQVHVRVVNGTTSPTNSSDTFTYFSPPTITSLSPAFGSTAGGTFVTVQGTNLSSISSVNFGGTIVTASNVTGFSFTVTAPAHSAGTVDVRVTTPGGTSANTFSDDFSYVNGPIVTGISPAGGPTAGGTIVTITGTGLLGSSSVTFGGLFASIISVTSNQIVVSAPAHSAGTVDVRVTNAAITSPNVLADNYSYATLPVVLAVSPSSGPTAGGTLVTLTGSGFLGATVVSFGGVGAAPTVQSDSQLIVVSPFNIAGSVHLLVTTPSGTSIASTLDVFTYTGVPVVTSISPASGPSSGGTIVTITGSGFLNATSVTFGSSGAGSIQVISNTTIVATSPAANASVVDVRVNNGLGTSPITLADQFTYIGQRLQTYALSFRWTLVVWQGPDNAQVFASIRGQETPDDPATNDVHNAISAIFRWNAPQQVWEGYFPSGEGVPGANDFSTFRTGLAYWIAIIGPGGLNWVARGQ